jgi:hypothetical protein
MMQVPKFTGELALERAGDENLHNINPDMGAVLREVIREQVRVKPLKRGQLKVTVACLLVILALVAR